MLLGEDHPAVAGLPDFRVDRVADDHPEQDSEGQGAKACAGDGRETTGPQGGAGQSGGQRQASGQKCHRERCLVGKVSAVITFSFVCLKVTPCGIKYKIDYMFIINRNKWLMAASPVTTGRERVRQKRGGLAGKTMIL